MTLPPLPEPAMVYAELWGGHLRCHNETQLIEYGRVCAEAMREACAAECDRWASNHAAATEECTYANCDFVAAATDCRDAIRALEIEP